MKKSSCFLLFGSFLPCSLMLRAPRLLLWVWFCFVATGLVGFGLAFFVLVVLS